MARLDELLQSLVVTLDLLAPAAVLLLLWRWSRRWWTALIGTAILTPLAAFLLTGGVAWLSTYVRVVVRGDTSIPDANGESVAQYLGSTFGVCGGFGAVFAGTGLGLSLPLFGAWRLVHPRSFHRLTRRRDSEKAR